MKKYLFLLAVLTLTTLAVSVVYFSTSNRQPDSVNASKILAAAKSYAADLKTKGLPLPASVSLKDMISRGLLTEADVSGFSGVEVTISLSPDERRPVDVLARARLADGYEMVAFMDGSVQQARR